MGQKVVDNSGNDDTAFAEMMLKALGPEPEVWPGQRWRFPDGEVYRVGAISSGGGERQAFLVGEDGGVMRLPARTLASTAQQVNIGE